MSSLKAQMLSLKKAAKKRGLQIRRVENLSKTPFRAMNPRAAKAEGIRQWNKHTIGYEHDSSKTKRRLVMDMRHEIVEYDAMGRGLPYKRAHKLANRKQRNPNLSL